MSDKTSKVCDAREFYGSDDPATVGAYTLADAAWYLRIPLSTVMAWTRGRPYPTRSGTRRFVPVIDTSASKHAPLSFVNLVELHVLNAIRKEHRVALNKIRKAVTFLRSRFRTTHPLATEQFQTDGVDLFVEEFGALISASEGGQLVLRDVLLAHLKRVERDARGAAIRLFPFIRSGVLDEPRTVAIDPRVEFGRPTVFRTGTPTRIIGERFRAGDSIEVLAAEYGASPQEIVDAIRCEMPAAA